MFIFLPPPHFFSMALQPFGYWPLFQFLNRIHRWSCSLDGGSARRKAATYTEVHKQTKTHTDIRALSGIRTHDPRVQASEDGSCLRPRGHSDRYVQLESVIITPWVIEGEKVMSPHRMSHFVATVIGDLYGIRLVFRRINPNSELC
jgi:hypothetical protein